MMLMDSGFLYATIDKRDANHQRVMTVLPTLSGELVLPTVALVETAYLLYSRLGHATMRHMISQLEQSPIRFEPTYKSDLPRIYQLLEQYADLKLDLVDASLVVIAERLDVRQILTVDRRDFRIIRPVHCDYFELLP